MQPFWEKKTLQEMTPAEWESLCDGCARCCLLKYENERGDILYTNVACRQLDTHSCRCVDYEHRASQVPECLVLTAENLAEHTRVLPPTCAYRLILDGKPLPPWHPLRTGHRGTVHAAGISIRGRALSERFVHPDQIPEQVVEWPKR